MRFSGAHALACLLGAYTYFFLGITAQWLAGDIILLDAMGSVFLAMFSGIFMAIIFFFVTLPAGMLGYKLTRAAGYTEKLDYALLGLTMGFMMAWVFEGFLVEIYMENNDYREIFGLERMLVYLEHYLTGGLVGVVYSLTYWHQLVAPTAEASPLPSPLLQRLPARKPRAAKGRGRQK